MTQTLTRDAKGKFTRAPHNEAHRFHGDQIGTDAGYEDQPAQPRVIRQTPLEHRDVLDPPMRVELFLAGCLAAVIVATIVGLIYR